MEIGNPSYLWLLLLLLIPILIHLLNLRRTKKIYFSNTGLINVINQKQGKKAKWMKILTLVTRCFFLICCILSFLNLKKTSQSNSRQYQKNIIYFDNSLSMGSQGDLKGDFHQARDFLNESLEAFPNAARFKLITNDFFDNTDRYLSKSEIIKSVGKLKNSYSFRTISDIYTRFGRDEANVLFISDFQESMFLSMPSAHDTLQSLMAIKPQNERKSNLYIDTAYLSDAYLIDNFENRLLIKVKNDGESNIKDVGLKVFLNEILISTLSLNVNSQSTKVVSVSLRQKFDQFNKGKISIEDGVAPFDDTYYFSLNKNKRINIVEIKNDKAASKGNIQSVFANKNLFSLSSYNIGNVDYAKLIEADFVILNGINVANDIFLQRISEARSNGVSMIVVPSVDDDKGTLLKKIVGRKVSHHNNGDSLFVQRLDFDFFQGVFDNRKEQFNLPYCRPMISINGGVEKFLDLGFGKAIVTYIPEQSTYVFSSPLQRKYTNFHQHSLFVPFMYKIVFSKKGSDDELAYRMGQSGFSRQLSNSSEKGVFSFINTKTEEEYTPDQRIFGGKELIFNIPKGILSAGNYKVMENGRQVDLLAFNYEREESMISSPTDKELVQRFSAKGINIELFDSNSPLGVIKKVKGETSGIGLWKVFLVIALLFLFIEILIIRFL